MWQVGFTGGNHVGKNELAVAGDGERDPFGARCVAALCDQVKTASREPPAEQAGSDVDHGHDSATAHHDAFYFLCLMRKAKDSAGRDQLGDIARGNGETALRKPKQHERLGLGRRCHWIGPTESRVASFENADGMSEINDPGVALLDATVGSTSSPVGVSAGSTTESSAKSSSGVRNPSGFTTGTTIWSMAVSPRYQPRSSLQNAWGKAWSRVIVIIFSMPSTRRAVRVRRNTKTKAAGEVGRLKCR